MTTQQLRRQLTAAVDTLRTKRMSAGRTTAGTSARGQYGANIRELNMRIQELASEAKAAGVDVRDEIPTLFADHKCRQCGHYGRMRRRRDLVANEQMRVCPECGEEQREQTKPVY